MKRILIGSMLLLLAVGVSQAATYTYTGSNGSNWGSAANWGGTLPGAGDTGIIDGVNPKMNVVLAGAPTIDLRGGSHLLSTLSNGVFTNDWLVSSGETGKIRKMQVAFLVENKRDMEEKDLRAMHAARTKKAAGK